MIVFVSEQLTHHLIEPDNFRKFSVEIALPKGRLDELRSRLGDIVEFDDDSNAWVSADALQAMSKAPVMAGRVLPYDREGSSTRMDPRRPQARDQGACRLIATKHSSRIVSRW